MNIRKTPLSGFLIIEPKIFKDERGFFLETYQEERYINAGIYAKFIQDNQSRSTKGVLRGMHYQIRRPQAQLLTVLRGEIFDVVVDLRANSSTFGAWHGTHLSDRGARQVFMAPGFAHGFCVLSEVADLHYKVTCNYDPSDEGGLNSMDNDLSIAWPVQGPVISARDASYPAFKSLNADKLPILD